jgi:hypothetical protein
MLRAGTALRPAGSSSAERNVVNRRAKIKPAVARQRPFIDQKLSSRSAREDSIPSRSRRSSFRNAKALSVVSYRDFALAIGRSLDRKPAAPAGEGLQFELIAQCRMRCASRDAHSLFAFDAGERVRGTEAD